MTYLYQFFELHFSRYVGVGFPRIQIGECPELCQFVVLDIRSVLLGE
jgi:hypothetical protein